MDFNYPKISETPNFPETPSCHQQTLQYKSRYAGNGGEAQQQSTINQTNQASNAKVAQFHKTRMCLNMANCTRQSRCNYAHSISELRCNLNLSRTKVCKAFQQGKCRNEASHCNFAHGLKELVSTFGYFKTKKCPDENLGCHKGVYCRNYHTEYERKIATRFIGDQADQSVGSVKHLDFYNYWMRVDSEGCDEFIRENDSKLNTSTSFYRRMYGNHGGTEPPGLVATSVVSKAERDLLNMNSPLPSNESRDISPENDKSLNYAAVAAASIERDKRKNKEKNHNAQQVQIQQQRGASAPTIPRMETIVHRQVEQNMDICSHAPVHNTIPYGSQPPPEYLNVNPNYNLAGSYSLSEPNLSSKTSPINPAANFVSPGFKYGSLDYGHPGQAGYTNNGAYGGSFYAPPPHHHAPPNFMNPSSLGRFGSGVGGTHQMLNNAALKQFSGLSSFGSFGSSNNNTSFMANGNSGGTESSNSFAPPNFAKIAGSSITDMNPTPRSMSNGGLTNNGNNGFQWPISNSTSSSSPNNYIKVATLSTTGSSSASDYTPNGSCP